MKQISKWSTIATIIVSFVALNLSGQAKEDSPQSYDLPKYNVQGIDMPEITKLIVPRIPNSLQGEETVMYFTIGTKGEVYNVRSKDRTPGSDLPVIMKRALYGWKFSPAVDDNGNPVAIKVALPVRVTPANERAGTYASSFDPMKLELIGRVN